MARPRRRETAGPGAARRWTASRAALAACGAFLLLTMDDRHAGRISDECQIVYSAVAITETGSLKLSDDPRRLGTPPAAPDGGRVSKYGIGATVLQLPAAFLASAVERDLGPKSSGPLFLVAPLLLVLAAAWASSRITVSLGGSETAAALAILLAVLATPLGSYSATLLSEPLQAASLAGVLACSLASTRSEKENVSLAFAAAAGALVGVALLSKSVLLAVAPPLALPLLATDAPGRAWRRAASASAAFLAVGGVWALIEMRRFGALLGGYGNESFSHPVWDGLVRILFFPNRGLVFFFPAVLVAIPVIVRHLRQGGAPSSRRLAAAAVPASFAILTLLYSAWWCWYGNAGWGPRFLVPAIPLLVPFSAIWLSERRRGVQALALGAGIVLNLPPLFTHPNLINGLFAWIPRQEIPASRARTLPDYIYSRGPDGKFYTPANHTLPYVQAASPHLIFPWLAWVGLSSSPQLAAERFRRPPWLASDPAAFLEPMTDPAHEIPWVAPAFRWGWGRGFFSSRNDPAAAPVYLDALENQVRRLLGRGPSPLLTDLARKRQELSPGGDPDAYYLEALRLSRMRETAMDFVGRLTPSARSWPATAAAIALTLRDLGQDGEARRAMQVAAAGGPPSGPFARAASLEPLAWPPGLAALLDGKP